MDLPEKLRKLASTRHTPNAAAEGLPAGLGHVDDVIVLLQPVRIAASGEELQALEDVLRQLAEKNFLTGTQAVGADGVWAGLVGGCSGRGFHAEFSETEGASAAEALLAEHAGRALVSARPKAHVPLANFVEKRGRFTAEAIGRVTAREVRVRWMGEVLLDAESFDQL